jgi:hypothetical protein
MGRFPLGSFPSGRCEENDLAKIKLDAKCIPIARLLKKISTERKYTFLPAARRK